jgi:hypothetical protein
LVQPSSKKLEKKDGKEAQPGEFYFNDTKESFESLEICYLKGKVVDVNFPKKDGSDDWKRQLKVLAITTKPMAVIIINLSVTSFGAFGRFKSQLKAKQAMAGYEYKTLIYSHKEENEQGKYYVVDFEVGEKNSEQELSEYAKVFEDYKNVLDTKKEESDRPF